MKQSATLDSSFWINCHRSGLASHIVKRFELIVPRAVATELKEEFASGREFWRLKRQDVIALTTPKADVVRAFGPGERAAMNLAMEYRDWVLLIDDWRPLREAQSLGLAVVSSPVFVCQLKSEDEISLREAVEALARLASLGTVRQGLISAAISQLAASKPEGGTTP